LTTDALARALLDAARARDWKLATAESSTCGPLAAAITAMSEPMVSHDVVAFHLLSQEVARHVKVVQSGQGSDIRPGNAMPLRFIPVGTVVHNVEFKAGAGGKMARSAGSSIQLVAKEGDFATLRLPSTEMRRVPIDCRATVGEVGNAEHELIKIGKAGRNRWKGVRPQTRGVAMNPVDHPHGGGEGKTSGGRHPVSPWGKPEGRTRDTNKPSQQLIVRRRRTRGSRR